jgi:hypothetical protein
MCSCRDCNNSIEIDESEDEAEDETIDDSTDDEEG